MHYMFFFLRFAIPFSWTCDRVTGAVSFDLKFIKRQVIYGLKGRDWVYLKNLVKMIDIEEVLSNVGHKP